jgi:sugar phosphate isomerase/epimerase
MPNIQCAALQLYTVRDMTQRDFAGTMKKVADIGYKLVETAGYGNLKTAKEAKKALDDAGLKPVSGHFAIDLLESKIEQVVEDAQTLELEMVVCPFLPEERRKDAAGYVATAKVLEKAGLALHQYGPILAYHNHNFEFQKYDGKYGLEIIFENSQPHLVAAEVDVYWVKNAGVDPVQYLTKLGDRVRALHLKDMLDTPDKRFAPVGTGVIDFKAILAVAEKNGVRYGIVEQDRTYDKATLDSIKTSLENLKKLGAV